MVDFQHPLYMATPRYVSYPSAQVQGQFDHFKAIETALRDCAQIPVKEFALVVLLENGEEKTYSSTSLKAHWPKIFSERFKRDFHQCATGWVGNDGSFPNSGQFNPLQYRQRSTC